MLKRHIKKLNPCSVTASARNKRQQTITTTSVRNARSPQTKTPLGPPAPPIAIHTRISSIIHGPPANGSKTTRTPIQETTFSQFNSKQTKHHAMLMTLLGSCYPGCVVRRRAVPMPNCGFIYAQMSVHMMLLIKSKYF